MCYSTLLTLNTLSMYWWRGLCSFYIMCCSEKVEKYITYECCICIFIWWGIATNGRPCQLPYHCRDNLGMRPANERQPYIVTSSLIGRAHTQNDPYIAVGVEGCRLVTIVELLKWIFTRLYNSRMLCPLCHVQKQSPHRIFGFARRFAWGLVYKARP